MTDQEQPPTAWDKFNNAPSWKVALIAVAIAWLGKGGFDTLVNRWLHDSAPFEAVAIEKLDNLQKSVDKLWQIKGDKHGQTTP